MDTKRALIVGASGLVGSELLQILLKGDRYSEIVAFVRTPLPIKHHKLKVVTVDFDKLADYQNEMDVQDVYCCLGTTIKKAKSQENMYKVDVHYPLTLAKLVQEKGIDHFILVSAMNANSKSKFFYSRIKGELEEHLKALPLPALSIVQPSLLLGEREEFRFTEKVADWVFKSLSWMLKDSTRAKWGIEAKTVAYVMYRIAQLKTKGTNVYSAQDMASIAKKVQVSI
ncbi:NAD(P)H-binding protein [Alkalihalobacillus sp. 1P02AB]|uniref:NAD(P)H-binding protein n=1 Tax=Alkalihalobacillus sp. 1P02AB TaxID=3132260 RepID=UPI0039A74D8F